jgi:prepilin-type N-terminal cleavage/methylation domain-containing protein
MIPMKKFLKKAEGFTLVELIVVIAILGILTAVAVPTYSGYVKKANEAGDTQTLSAANTAIAAAFTENNIPRISGSTNNVDQYLKFTPGDADSDGKKEVTVASKPTSGDAKTIADKLVDSFELYYGGDVLDEFNYYTGVTVQADGNLKGNPPA